MLLKKASEFIYLMHDEQQASKELTEQRISEIRSEIDETGTYTHTTEELVYGAKVAWRQSNRCIGRLFWENLEVRDMRHINEEEAFTDSIERHIEETTNNGKIRPMISVYSNEIKIYNEQLIRYAGYESKGDPRSVPSTKLASRLGWDAAPADFNILPLMYSVGSGNMKHHVYPEGLVKEVDITHDAYPKLAALNLKWYGVPIISNMDLEIGGLRYHTAPFNGWYMETEIGVRNFTDEYRYDKLPEIAEAFGLDTSKTTTYWRDRALVEFNYAVYHSFRQSRVSMVDHITASKQFELFEKKEQARGRKVTGKWSWLAPPLSPSLVHNYHHGYDDELRSPNFLYRENKTGCPFS